MADASLPASFWTHNPEKEDFNQYWYSEPTIRALVAEIEAIGGAGAFLSTPSVYFSLSDDARGACHVFDFDKKWSGDRGFVHYDFNKPLDFPETLRAAFDFVVIDPPFITKEVWEKYAETAKALLKADGSGKVIASTITENAPLMERLLGVKPQPFKPSIPHLVYQYDFYANYETTALAAKNPEIPDD